MEFVRGIYNLKSYHRTCVLTIGNFDGFHRGHQALIFQLKKLGSDFGLPVIVMIFEPHPREYFFGGYVRLSNLRDKIKYFSSSGIDVLLCILFDLKFSLLEPYSFIYEFLVRKLDVRLLCIGDNFRFGSYRYGDFNFLKKMGTQFGFEVMKIGTCVDQYGKRISSTAIRRALKNDQLITANILLGHVYSISGRVVYGKQIGGLIGFPTLNISLKGQRLPINGVYAVKVYGIVSNRAVLGVANIGICPTVNEFFQQKFEVHLLDWAVNLYGCYVEVVICSKIRNERYFASCELLKRQICYDIDNARIFFIKK